jgi:predicted HAD superfamily Cof-like phosphohydrolase
MQSYETLMREFMDQRGQYRNTTPGPIPITVAMLRIRLIVEEFAEYADCSRWSNRNTVHMADALGDLAYVVIGTYVTYGLPVPLLEGKLDDKEDDLGIELLAVALGQLTVTIHMYQMGDGELERVELALRALYQSVLNTAVEEDIPFDLVFREIHRSNMTKSVPTFSASSGKKLGDMGKGPDYEPPRIAEILEANRVAK